MMFRRWVAVAWTLVILGLCWMPRKSMPVQEHGPPFLNIPHLDKVVHFGIFLVFALLWSRVGASPRRFVKVAAWGVVLAVVSELGQMIPVVNRDAGFLDGLADAVGVAAGIGFYLILPGGKLKKPTPQQDPSLAEV